MGGGENSSSSEYWHNSQLQLHGETLFFILIRLLSFLLILLLVLFFFCRYSRAFPKQKDDDLIHRQLPVVFYEALKKQVSVVECCICLGLFEDHDNVKVLPVCGHCFHSDCVDTWLSTRSTCPLCRAALRLGSLV